MPEALCTVTFASSTGVTSDSVTNTFAFNGIAADGSQDAALMAKVLDFFNGASALSGWPIARFMSLELVRAANKVDLRVYDIAGGRLDGSPHGSPRNAMTGTLAAGGPFDNLPTEVACVCSLEAVGRAEAPVNVPAGVPGPEGDLRPRQRKSGRIYIGPLNTFASGGSPAPVRPAANFIDTIHDAADRLHDGLTATMAPAQWGVWSRKDAEVNDVVAVTVDNAFDTQRRRGPRATTRTRRTL